MCVNILESLQRSAQNSSLGCFTYFSLPKICKLISQVHTVKLFIYNLFFTVCFSCFYPLSLPGPHAPAYQSQGNHKQHHLFESSLL